MCIMYVLYFINQNYSPNQLLWYCGAVYWNVESLHQLVILFKSWSEPSLIKVLFLSLASCSAIRSSKSDFATFNAGGKSNWVCLISNIFCKKKNTFYFHRDFFNWTMTFRRDSDIIDSYGPIAVAKVGENPALSSYAYKLRPKGLLESV